VKGARAILRQHITMKNLPLDS